VTNDIARAFGLTHDQAEHLKCSSGPVTADSINTIRSSDFSESLSNVIDKRMQDIFTNILAEIETEGMQKRIAAGVVLTGGGAKSERLVAMVESVFQRSCVAGCPVGYTGLDIIRTRPEYSSVAGLVRYGFTIPS
jgi:cell division protein FtsA